MGYIIDISHHQDPVKIDYDKLAKQLDLVIIRTQYGSRTIDRHYKTHHREFKKRGIPTATYAWVRGKCIPEMRKEAASFCDRTRQFNPTFWFLDVEEKSMSDMRSGVSAYVDQLRKLGVEKIGIYIAHHLYQQFNLNLDEVEAVWIPHYGRNIGKVDSKPAYPCDLHQYTSRGRLNGYSGYLDLNRPMNGRTIEFFTDEVKSKPQLKPKQQAKEITYIVKKGDTLSEIAAKYKTTVDKLAELNNIKNVNLIYPGQKIRISVAAKKQEKIHIVKKGDTLWDIAKKYNTTIKKLAKDNGIKDPNLIYPGQKIKIK
ncbi:MAG: LysM peptidoglycan-binding domain-containing protein [Clostridia bacterium]|nr:LysM peptidoglycan-binding domain-containing protein [Clostridia bacterium]